MDVSILVSGVNTGIVGAVLGAILIWTAADIALKLKQLRTR